jgi:hypothetical protein
MGAGTNVPISDGPTRRQLKMANPRTLIQIECSWLVGEGGGLEWIGELTFVPEIYEVPLSSQPGYAATISSVTGL